MSNISNDELKKIIKKLLYSLGFDDKLLGFAYLEFCIFRYIEYYNNYHEDVLVAKVIYPSCAKVYKCSAESVDRSIRFCIKQCWRFGNTELQCKLFAEYICFESIYPSVKIFIKAVSKYIIYIVIPSLSLSEI